MSSENPTPRPVLTVNIKEWLEKRNIGGVQPQPTVQIPDMASYATVEEYQEKLAEAYVKQQTERQRASKLEAKAKECGECSQVEKHYRDDYMCYACRDRLDA